MSTKKFIPFQIDVSNRIPNAAVANAPKSSTAKVRKFGKNLRADAAHNGIEARRAKELASIGIQLFQVTTESFQSILRDVVSAGHWVMQFRAQHVTDGRVDQLANEISIAGDQLFQDCQHVAALRNRLSNDESIVTYDAQVITADALARLSIGIESVGRIVSLYKETVLSAAHPLSATILNRLESSKLKLKINQQQCAELSRIITILRDDVRTRHLAEGTHLNHAQPKQQTQPESKTQSSQSPKPKALFKRLLAKKTK